MGDVTGDVSGMGGELWGVGWEIEGIGTTVVKR